MIVYVRHTRKAKLCAAGARAWFAARGWSWASFVAEGRSADDLRATGDPLALKAVEAAALEAEHGRQ